MKVAPKRVFRQRILHRTHSGVDSLLGKAGFWHTLFCFSFGAFPVCRLGNRPYSRLRGRFLVLVSFHRCLVCFCRVVPCVCDGPSIGRYALATREQARCLTGISMKQGRPPARSGAAVRKRHGPVRAFPGNSPSPPGRTSRHRGFPSRKAWRTSRHRPRPGDDGRTESRTGGRGNPMNCG